MAEKIFVIWDNENSLKPHLEAFKIKGYKVRCESSEHAKLLDYIQKWRPSLIILNYQGLQKTNRNLYSLCVSLSRHLQNISILLTCHSKLTQKDVEPFSNMIDDIVFLPISKEDLLQKVLFWSRLSSSSEHTASSKKTRRTTILESNMEKVRRSLRRGDFGRAAEVLERVQSVLETIEEKSTEVERISIILESLHSFVEKGQSLPLVTQLNMIDLSLYPSSWEMILAEIEQGKKELTERAKEELTRPLEMKDFLQAKAKAKKKKTEKPVKEIEISETLKKSEELSPQSKEVEEVLASPRVKIRPSDSEFARKLLHRRLISKQQLIRALEEQKNMEVKGQPVPLSNVMLTHKIILPIDIQRVFGPNAITSFFCNLCLKHYRVLNLSNQPPEHFRCRICPSPLTEPPEEDIFILPDEEREENESIAFDIEIPIEPIKENIPLLLQRAALLNRRREILKALEIYEQILKIAPENEACHLGRLRLLIENKDYGKTIKESNAFLKHNPNNYQAICHRGVAYYYTHELNKSIEDLSLLIEKQLYNYISFSTRGKAYYRLKQYQKAIEDLTRAIVLAPDFVKGFIYRGKAYLQINKNKLAIDDFREALKINPEYGNAAEVEKMIEIAQNRGKIAKEKIDHLEKEKQENKEDKEKQENKETQEKQESKEAKEKQEKRDS